MKKSRLQKVIHAVVAVVLSLITIFSTTVGAFAWTVDGSGVASGGGSSSGGKDLRFPMSCRGVYKITITIKKT